MMNAPKWIDMMVVSVEKKFTAAEIRCYKLELSLGHLVWIEFYRI